MDCFVVSLLAMTNETRDSTPTLSLRGFKKAAAISGWDIGTVKQNSSLRELLLQFVAISVLGTIVYLWNSFSFLFLCLLLVVVDCFVVSLLAMTKGGGWCLWLIFLLTMIKRVVMVRTKGLWQSNYSRLVIARVRRTRGNP